MRHADMPTTEVDVEIAASPDAVWALVSDIELPARFSNEFQGATWLHPDTPPGIGMQFVGRNEHPAIGSWQVTCTVIEWVEGRTFGWLVGDPEAAAASWRFDLEPHRDGTRLRFWAQMGPGPSGVTTVIGRNPDAEEQIVANRLEQWRENMMATVAGIKDLAEAETAADGS